MNDGLNEGAKGLPQDEYPVVISDAENILVQVNQGKKQRIVGMAGDHNISLDGTPRDGQLVSIQVTADAGGDRMPTWATTQGTLSFYNCANPVEPIAAGRSRFFMFQWDGSAKQWDCLAIS